METIEQFEPGKYYRTSIRGTIDVYAVDGEAAASSPASNVNWSSIAKIGEGELFVAIELKKIASSGNTVDSLRPSVTVKILTRAGVVGWIDISLQNLIRHST